MRAAQSTRSRGLAPLRALARPLASWWESGASTIAFMTVGAESTSPQPVMPSSVSIPDEAGVLGAVGGDGDVGQTEHDGFDGGDLHGWFLRSVGALPMLKGRWFKRLC